MNRLLGLFIVILMLCVSLDVTNTYGQNPVYRLTVRSGGFMDFKIYSLDRYDGGLVYNDWTKLRVVYKDSTGGRQFNTWNLGVKAATPELQGSALDRNLPLDYISIEVNDGDTLSNNATIDHGPHKLSENTLTNIVSGGDEGTYTINITYRLDSSLVGKLPDYYTTELLFEMEINP